MLNLIHKKKQKQQGNCDKGGRVMYKLMIKSE